MYVQPAEPYVIRLLFQYNYPCATTQTLTVILATSWIPQWWVHSCSMVQAQFVPEKDHHSHLFRICTYCEDKTFYLLQYSYTYLILCISRIWPTRRFLWHIATSILNKGLIFSMLILFWNYYYTCATKTYRQFDLFLAYLLLLCQG